MSRALPSRLSASAERMLAGLSGAGLKRTPQRIAVVAAFADDESHPTAQEIFERLGPTMPTMSFATVYTTLETLRSVGLCSARALTPGATRFDPNTLPHHHALCESCGAMMDVAPLARSGSRRFPLPPAGFVVRAVETIYRGECARCFERKKTRDGLRGRLGNQHIKERRHMAKLEGTKTHQNLKDAFAGESQANRRYLYFAKKADIEGLPDVAGLFKDTADGETGHAHGHLDFLRQVGDPATGLPIGDSALNLKAAVAGETHEYETMYPGMSKTAREEGFADIAEWFETLAKAEKSHAGRFQKALDALLDTLPPPAISPASGLMAAG